MKEDEPDFLDPKQNPLIPTADPEPAPDNSDLEYRCPMGGIPELTLDELAENFRTRFTDRDRVQISEGLTMMRMADDSWALDGRPLKDLTPGELQKVRDFLRTRKV